MTSEKNEGYQYNRCSSRGICSINPATASFQEIILIYLKHAAYYGLKLAENGKKDKKISSLILNTLSVLSSNYEISEVNFKMINSVFQAELPKVIQEFNNICTDCEIPDIDSFLKTESDLNDYIRYGEKKFNKRLQALSESERNLYIVLFDLTKSFCINILTYESFGADAEDEIILIYKVLNFLNTPFVKKEDIKKVVSEISESDCNLMKKIRKIQEETYGKQEENEVCFSTEKGKALLVVGSNLKELETILDFFEDYDVDIYTHDNMILAHTFPKFHKYKNLKGQFGQGMENCLLDFSTFPGPIILTKHSLFNVENLYRGILYTTDFAYSKGVIPIRNNDFCDVIKSLEKSRGFKTGKACASEKIGFSQAEVLTKIKNKIAEGKYKRIILAGTGGYSAEEKEYFKSFVNHAPSDTLIISLFCCEQRENVICINAANDVLAMNILFEAVMKTFSLKITLIFPYSGRHNLSVIINSAKYRDTSVYVGKWADFAMKQGITECLKSEFGVHEVTVPKNDMNNITDGK